MYNAFYKLNEDPFRLTPDPAFLYMTSKHREALSGLVYSVCNKSGLTVLVGEVGTGKTTLLHVFQEWLAKRRFVTALCTNPVLSRDEFFDLLLSKLDIKCSSSLKSRQLMALEQELPRYHQQGRRPILIVDEAHRLSPELLEEIRLLLNLETAREKFLDIIIAGQPELAEMLATPELRQLKQRISCYCRLDALSLPETTEYVQHRLAHAGLPQQTIFPDETLETIYQYTQGIPRLVSSLCSGALQIGFALQSPAITVPIVNEAAKDLDMQRTSVVMPVNGNGKSAHNHVTAPQSMPVPVIPPAPVSTPQPPVSLPRIEEPAGKKPAKVPMESYSSRQKSLGFLSSLIDRWT